MGEATRTGGCTCMWTVRGAPLAEGLHNGEGTKKGGLEAAVEACCVAHGPACFPRGLADFATDGCPGRHASGLLPDFAAKLVLSAGAALLTAGTGVAACTTLLVTGAVDLQNGIG
mmetsp:Transcript_2134/g.4904  ORF Transcript_2134/g.4904 Transcript_2134/m.4904 type:complete len:115 (-) Transcript_2134:393-737(-)